MLVTEVTRLAVTAAAAESLLRPSSARRLGNLRALVAEFAARDIGHAGVALFLPCSSTTARNYIAELLGAGLIIALPARQAAGGLDRTLYRRTADPLSVNVSRRAGPAPARRDPLVAALFGVP